MDVLRPRRLHLELEKQNVQLQQQLAAARATAQDADFQRRAEAARADDLQQHLAHAEEQRTALRKRLEHLSSSGDDSMHQVLAAELAGTQRQLQAAKAALDSARRDLRDADATAKAAEATARQREVQRKQVTDLLVAAQREAQAADTRADRANAAADKATTQLRVLQAEVDGLREEQRHKAGGGDSVDDNSSTTVTVAVNAELRKQLAAIQAQMDTVEDKHAAAMQALKNQLQEEQVRLPFPSVCRRRLSDTPPRAFRRNCSASPWSTTRSATPTPGEPRSTVRKSHKPTPALKSFKRTPVLG